MGFAETELVILNRLARISMARISHGVAWRAMTVSGIVCQGGAKTLD